MPCSAYGSLSDEMRGGIRGRSFSAIFGELARKFQLMASLPRIVGGRVTE